MTEVVAASTSEKGDLPHHVTSMLLVVQTMARENHDLYREVLQLLVAGVGCPPNVHTYPARSVHTQFTMIGLRAKESDKTENRHLYLKNEVYHLTLARWVWRAKKACSPARAPYYARVT
jgi:hypothetical protein